MAPIDRTNITKGKAMSKQTAGDIAKKQAKRGCPIGLGDNPDLCSAGTCGYCVHKHYQYKLQQIIEEVEGLKTHALESTLEGHRQRQNAICETLSILKQHIEQ